MVLESSENLASTRSSSSEILQCVVCGHVEDNFVFPVREMMFGFRDKFRYAECARCKCIYRLDAPISMRKYYPSAYGAHTLKARNSLSISERVRRRLIAKHALRGNGFLASY